SIAVATAKQTAHDVAFANGLTIDPETDVQFGKRVYDDATGAWPIQWGQEPYNVVKVVTDRDNDNVNAPDGKLKLAFGWAVGQPSIELHAASTAFVEARDLVLVLDFSASMNDDSSIKSFSKLGQTNVEQSLDAMWDALVASDVTWPNSSTKKFKSTGFGKVDSYYGTYYSSSKKSKIFKYLDLDDWQSGGAKYPYPQSGRYSNGQPKPKPSYYSSRSFWYGYINYTKNLSGTYRKRYGYRTLMNYMQEQRYKNSMSEDLWRTPHYPFHAVKEGATMFLDFLEDLDFGDEVGLVSYGGYSKFEQTLDDGVAVVDITSNPITADYNAVDTMQRHKQAGHYDGWTGMGYGIRDAKILLIGDSNVPSDDGHSRYGARPTMIIMTDGQTNQGPSGFNFPAGWDWADWTDYDGDGDADYSTSDSKKKYAFWEATEAIERGVTVHTMSVGVDADRDLMEAIAFAGKGVWMNVPGGSNVQEMEEQLLDAFRQIAARVPAAKLVYDD
ncbi:MAG: VWA domain-containing protein, partial [Pirellulaceae bacterium]|nr:VWA domain-containing protein [Pirellulaceae bacterium]